MSWLDPWAGLTHHSLCSGQIFLKKPKTNKKKQNWKKPQQSGRVVCFSQYAWLGGKREVSYWIQKKEGVFFRYSFVGTLACQETRRFRTTWEGQVLLYFKASPFSHRQQNNPCQDSAATKCSSPRPWDSWSILFCAECWQCIPWARGKRAQKRGMTFSFKLWSLRSITIRENLNTWVGFPAKRMSCSKFANAAHMRQHCLKNESQGFSNKAETLHIPRNVPYLSVVLPGTWRGWDQRDVPGSSFNGSSFAKSQEEDCSGRVEWKKNQPKTVSPEEKELWLSHWYILMGDEQHLRAKLAAQPFLQVWVSAHVQRQRPERGDLFACPWLHTHVA